VILIANAIYISLCNCNAALVYLLTLYVIISSEKGDSSLMSYLNILTNSESNIICVDLQKEAIYSISKTFLDTSYSKEVSTVDQRSKLFQTGSKDIFSNKNLS